ncbi:MAG: DUF2304 domain-containing protein [Varibaculum cambriense]|uniref:DUF2304 domain-containing protein n=1 Tax=Varibaculum cambriense TaxID=184870 RepID=UPI00290F40CE|nr:DUF2304 domain-containing protein [Varibaculum cambriense]MDU5316702.1 DUF2304 domain-containing protein [Varibaculum cambriense]MDU7408147.1 DUF2304 domain-containing protein [Varibaculum cambriense]
MLIKILLIVLVLGLSLFMFKANLGAKQTAWRRLGILAFAIVAVVVVIFPGITTTIARFLGVGRGADLLLYGLVVVVLYNMLMQAKQRNAAERRLTKLAREVAITHTVLGEDEKRISSGGNDLPPTLSEESNRATEDG